MDEQKIDLEGKKFPQPEDGEEDTITGKEEKFSAKDAPTVLDKALASILILSDEAEMFLRGRITSLTICTTYSLLSRVLKLYSGKNINDEQHQRFVLLIEEIVGFDIDKFVNDEINKS